MSASFTFLSHSTVILVLFIISVCNCLAAVKYQPQATASGQSTRLKQSGYLSSRMSNGVIGQPINTPHVSLAQPQAQAGSGGSSHQVPLAAGSLNGEQDYKCAQFCKCSIVQVLDQETRESRANLTQTRCESSKFSDILTIDRSTQIIHISLPYKMNEDDLVTNKDDDFSLRPAQRRPTSGAPFRMPRLVQFNILRELVISNLEFQVCDSEVFKRGQKLRRLRLNRNQLSRISKSCLRHLDKLIELNLDHNNLSELESALFSSLLNLRFLSIAHNRLIDLAAHQFANLTQLVSLNLVGNSFKVINLHLFEPMQNNLRVLILSRNEIKSFIHQAPVAPPDSTAPLATLRQLPFAGVVFKNLIKLNVDHNQIERIKLLQLHRFFNVKFLSIRHNKIAQIRDKAFNGLKLIELNLAHNKLLSISKCSFCNATIKRLVLANNNISFPLPNPLDPLRPPPIPNAAALIQGDLQIPSGGQPPASALPQTMGDSAQPPPPVPQSSSTQNVLILSQSILGPLFSQLEYLDLSNNELLANQLDMLLEPLLKLRYLNLANSGIDRSLPTPNLFKNQHQLKYLNLSYNQLDQVIAETIEPLTNLEVLDLSNNKFNELDESFMVTLDDLSSLRIIRLSQNPWFCSQCKVIYLYDWMLRSSVYNATCIAPSLAQQEQPSQLVSSGSAPGGRAPLDELAHESGSDLGDLTGANMNSGDAVIQSRFGAPRSRTRNTFVGHDYSLLIDPEDKATSMLPAATDIDFDLINSGDSMEDDIYLYPQTSGGSEEDKSKVSSHYNSRLRGLASQEDDESIGLTMATIVAGYTPPADYCSKCEFPGELRTFSIHELSPGDFKYCPGSGLRINASDPKIGLTLAIVIIGALFCIIIVVIIMYRKKSNAYYPGEDTDHLESANGANGTGGMGGGKKQPVFSISSDGEHQYGDNTDYSSPPMSQSFESITPSGSPDEEEDEELELEDEDEEIYDDEDEELDEEEDEDFDRNGHQGDYDDDDKDTGTSGQAHGQHSNKRDGDGNTSEHTAGKISSPETESHHNQQQQQHQEADKNQTEVKQLISQSASPAASSLSTAAKTLSQSHSRLSGGAFQASKTGGQSRQHSLMQEVVALASGEEVAIAQPAERAYQKSIMKPPATSEEPNSSGSNRNHVTMSTPQSSLKKQNSGSGGHKHVTTQAKLTNTLSGQSIASTPPTRGHQKVKMESVGDSDSRGAPSNSTFERQTSNGRSTGSRPEISAVTSSSTSGGGGGGGNGSDQYRVKVMKSARTVDQPASSKLRPAIASSRSESTGGTVARGVAEARRERQDSGQTELKLNARDLHNEQLDRNSSSSQQVPAQQQHRQARLAQMSKGAPKSGLQSPGQSNSSAGQLRTSRSGGRQRRQVSPPEVLTPPQIEPTKTQESWPNVMSPAGSGDDEMDDPDATSADSLAMEALDYLAASETIAAADDDDDMIQIRDDDPHADRQIDVATMQSGEFEVSSNNVHSPENLTSGGALVETVESLLSGDYEHELEGEDDDEGDDDEEIQFEDNEIERQQMEQLKPETNRLAKRRSQLRQPSANANFRLKPSTSTHSALTQTGSLSNEDGQ